MVFLDESGFSLLPSLPKTWALRGDTPVLRHRMCWPKLSAIAAACPNPHVWLHQVRGPVTSREVIRFVRYLLRVCPKRLMLFWDGLGAHWSRRTRKALGRLRDRLTLHRLPPYAPEMNPVEGLYAHLKGHLLRGYCPPDLPTLQRFLRRAVRNVQSRPRLIRSFFHRTPLSLFNSTSTYLCSSL
jgi:transposase